MHEKIEDLNRQEIILSDDKKLKEQLRLKLKEYKKRLSDFMNEAARQGKNLAYTAPEILMETVKDTEYKIKVLDLLLKNGKVDLNEFNGTPDDEKRFLLNAFGVIKSYVEAEGRGTEEGTGLPRLEVKGVK